MDFLNGTPSFGPLGNAAPSNASSSPIFNFATGAMGNGSDLLSGSLTGSPGVPGGLTRLAPWVLAGGLALWIILKK